MQAQVGHDGSTTWITPDATMIHIDSKGALTRLAQTYPSGSAKYGYEIMRHLSDIQTGALLLDKLERQQRIQLPSDSGVDAIRHTFQILLTVQKISDTLVEDLSSLASLHKEAWSQIMLETSMERGDEDIETDSQETNDHFTRAVNAYDAMLSVYQHLWRVVKPGASNAGDNQNFSPHDQAQILLGISMGHWNLYDVHNQWFVSTAGPTTFDDVSIQYRNLIQAESWCENALAILSGDDLEEVKEDHDAALPQARETMALIEARFGILLLDIYTQGYVLDIDGNLIQDPSSIPEIDVTMNDLGAGQSNQLGEGQTQFLELTTKKLSRGVALYTELTREHGSSHDYRRDIADSRQFMGAAYTYQFRWKDAAEELETCVSLYNQLFNEYQERRLDADSLEVVSSLLQTTQTLWGAYLFLSGKTDDAKKVFHRHLAFRRYYERRVPLEQPLEDEEGDEDTYYYSNPHNTGVEVQVEVKDYQMKLNEYLQLLSEYPLDGSYYDIEYSAELELADSLLNLAYAQKELKLWRTAAQSFSDAMDLYRSEKHLDGGEATDRSTKDKAEYLAYLSNKLTSFIKGQLGVKIDSNIIIDNYRMMENYIKTKGALTLLAQTYPSGSAKYGNGIMRHLSDIHTSALLLDKLERQQRIHHTSDSGVDAIRHTVQKILDTLVEDLSSLASLHKEAWSQIMLETSMERGDEDIETDSQETNDHFTRAVNAYDAMLSVYQHLWRVVKPGASNAGDNQNFSPHDQAQILLGISMGHWNLYDVHNQWFVSTAGPTTFDDVSIQYRNLIQAESWCENALAILSGDDLEEVKEDHDAALPQARETMALIEARFGILLLDIYTQGYVLDIDGNLIQDPSSIPEIDVTMNDLGAGQSNQLGEGQTQFLELTTKKLSRGVALYTELTREHGSSHDYRRDIADSRQFMGAAYTYQFRWKDAAEELETCVSLYNQLFNEYQERRLDADSLEVVSSLLQTTQTLWGAYLFLSGKTDDAKKVFHRHLAFRRYYERRVPLDQPLEDEEEDEDTYNYSNPHNTGVEVQVELKAYQMKLNEYLQLLSEYPPDGSYYELDAGFYSDGDASSLIKHDKVYEGSLRSAIGTLLLANNQVWEAIAELGLSVDLLREGASEPYVTYHENGEVIEYSVERELADSLMNLAYAQKELKLWNSAAHSFSDAMDLYKSEELPDGGGAIDRSTKDKEDYVASLGDKLTSFIKGQLGVKVDSNIMIDNYRMMDNTTVDNGE